MTTQVTSDLIADGAVTAVKLAANAVTNANVAAGAVVQMVSTFSGALVTGATQTPFDDTIPQSNEGTALPALDTAITPKSATNNLKIDLTVVASPNGVSHVILALFKDAGANALAATLSYVSVGTAVVVITLSWVEVAGSTSARTYKARLGNNAAVTTSINGSAAGRLFGGVMASSMIVTEIKA